MLFSRSDISSMGFRGSVEHAQEFAVATSVELTPMAAHAFETSAVDFVAVSVAGVVSGTRFTKVDPAVVERVGIAVVDYKNWVVASDHFPDQSMGSVRFIVDVDADSTEVFMASYRASAGHAATNFPTENPSTRVVIEEFEQAGLRWQRLDLHSGYNSGWLGACP